jgi:hypothetical protein
VTSIQKSSPFTNDYDYLYRIVDRLNRRMNGVSDKPDVSVKYGFLVALNNDVATITFAGVPVWRSDTDLFYDEHDRPVIEEIIQSRLIQLSKHINWACSARTSL